MSDTVRPAARTAGPTGATLTVLAEGPYVLTGAVEIVDGGTGRVVRTASEVSLCRCGRSADKPFCDGSHAAAIRPARRAAR